MIKNRITSLEKKFGLWSISGSKLRNILERYVDKEIHSDPLLLLKTIKALIFKDYLDHPNYQRAQEMLVWANWKNEFKLIPRAEHILEDLAAIGLIPCIPAKWMGNSLDATRVRPPSPFWCTAEQIETFRGSWNQSDR